MDCKIMNIDLRISSEYFVCGASIRNNYVVEAAPIISYMKKWDSTKVFQYCKKKNWSLEITRL